MMIRRIGFTLVVLAGLALAACGSGIPVEGTGADSGAAPLTAAQSDRTIGEALATGSDQPFDAAFMDQMIAQHRAAISVANQGIGRVKEPRLETIAAQIITTYEAEIERMEIWRQVWFPDLAAPDAAVVVVPAVPNGDTSYDVRFLDTLIPLQEQAIALAQQGDQQAENAELQTLIKSILVQQSNNLDQLKMWRAELSQ